MNLVVNFAYKNWVLIVSNSCIAAKFFFTITIIMANYYSLVFTTVDRYLVDLCYSLANLFFSNSKENISWVREECKDKCDRVYFVIKTSFNLRRVEDKLAIAITVIAKICKVFFVS